MLQGGNKKKKKKRKKRKRKTKKQKGGGKTALHRRGRPRALCREINQEMEGRGRDREKREVSEEAALS